MIDADRERPVRGDERQRVRRRELLRSCTMLGTDASLAGPHSSVRISITNEISTSRRGCRRTGSSTSSAGAPDVAQHHHLAAVQPVDEHAADGAEQEARAACGRHHEADRGPELSDTLAAIARIAKSPIQSPRLETNCAEQSRKNARGRTPATAPAGSALRRVGRDERRLRRSAGGSSVHPRLRHPGAGGFVAERVGGGRGLLRGGLLGGPLLDRAFVVASAALLRSVAFLVAFFAAFFAGAFFVAGRTRGRARAAARPPRRA